MTNVIISVSDLQVIVENTDQSHRKILNWPSIKRDHADYYECRGHYINSGRHQSQTIFVKVHGLHFFMN